MNTLPVWCHQSSVCGLHHNELLQDHWGLVMLQHARILVMTDIVQTPPHLYDNQSLSHLYTYDNHLYTHSPVWQSPLSHLPLVSSLVIMLSTVKPKIFTCPLFHEFHDLSKFAKITGHKYSNGNQSLSTSLTTANTNTKIKGAKIMS